MKDRVLTAHRRLFLPILVVLALAWPLPGHAQAGGATQPLESIAAAAEDHARQLAQDLGLDDAEVRAGSLDNRLRLKQCELPLETFSNDNNLRGGRTTVGVRCSGAAPWTLYVPVGVTAYTWIVLVDGPLPRGTVLNASHLRREQRPLNALPPQYLTNLDQAIGRTLTRAVSGATVASPNMLQTRDLIAKGQDVMILATGAKVQVRMAGVALQKGQEGDRIDVKNTSSGKTVQAVVVDGATVQVPL
ncbi:MAG: flagellar basal body P-ring formation chaperone FlgA [Pseudomonadota bacterium]|nr:flagellar basal body P-ring formation chaperone FlgA [Pseudomonadota bacterium]